MLIQSLANIQVLEKLDLFRFLEENKSARSKDMDHFHNIWTVQGDEKILEVNPGVQCYFQYIP